MSFLHSFLDRPNFVKQIKRKIVRENISEVQHKHKKGVPLRELKAMPFRTEARKCNHWATGGLLEKASKFNGTYMHVTCSFH